MNCTPLQLSNINILQFQEDRTHKVGEHITTVLALQQTWQYEKKMTSFSIDEKRKKLQQPKVLFGHGRINTTNDCRYEKSRSDCSCSN